MKKLYEITKKFRNGSTKYYVRTESVRMTEHLLERIGENTPSGHNYGYKIAAKIIRKLPKGEKLFPRNISKYIY